MDGGLREIRMSESNRFIQIAAVKLLGCELEPTGRTKAVHMQTADGRELCLFMPVAVAADLRAALDEADRDVGIPAFRTYRGE